MGFEVMQIILARIALALVNFESNYISGNYKEEGFRAQFSFWFKQYIGNNNNNNNNNNNSQCNFFKEEIESVFRIDKVQ